MRKHLWWWAFLVAVFVFVGQFARLSDAWSVVQYVVLMMGGLSFLLLIVDGFLELRERRGRNSRDGSS